jgi:integrase/recombinase XerD
MTLSTGIEEFLAALATERGLSRNTVAAYRRDLGQYREFLEDRDLTFPTPDDVSAFVAHLAGRGLASSTVSRKIAAVRGLHRFLAAEGLAPADPTVLVETPRRPASLPKALTVGEVQRLLDAPDRSRAAGRRDAALLEFLYATGARVSEATGAMLHDLDLDERTVLLTGKGDRQRIVPFGVPAAAAIRAYLPDRMHCKQGGTDPGFLFLNQRGRRLSRQGAWEIVRKQARRAGIATDQVSPHVLRHSVATHMVEGGADLRTVQELLGHATITTTQVYTRVTPRHLVEVYVTSHPRSR